MEKYRSEITNQTKTDNLNYSIDPAFSKVNRLFVLTFKSEENRVYFGEYYRPTVEIKDFYVVIEGKIFLMFQ